MPGCPGSPVLGPGIASPFPRHDKDYSRFAARSATIVRMRIAFFGGSFDPPHLGHLAVARAARAALALDRILFAPVGLQPLKPAGSSASFDDRVAMTRLAIADDPAFSLSLADAPAARPNYTIDTIAALAAEHPHAELFCLLGADSFLGLPRWHRGAELPFAAPLIVAARPGQPLDDLAAGLPATLTLASPPAPVSAPRGIRLLRAAVQNPDGRTAPLYLLPGLHVELSATDLRAQLADPAHHPGLPEPVFHYIADHALYRAD